MNRPIWQRIGAVLCFLLFICCFGFRITVDAVFTEGVVIGGTMAATEAALGEATTVAIGSSGLTDQLRDAADAAGQSVQAFVNDRIAAYNAVASGSTLLPLMAVDLMRSLTYTPDGKLIFSEEFSSAFSSFMDWMADNGDIILPSFGGDDISVTVPDDLNTLFSGIISSEVYFSSSPQSFSRENMDNNYGIVRNNSDFVYYGFVQYKAKEFVFAFVSNSYFECTNSYNSSQWSAAHSVTYGSETFYVCMPVFYAYTYNGGNFAPTPSYFTAQNSNGFLSTSDSIDAWGYSVLFGTTTGASNGLDVWNDADDGVVLDPTSLLGDALAGLQGAIANVGDYIGTLANVIAGVGNPALPVVGVGDIPISIPADIVIPVSPAIPADIADSEPATGEDAEEPYTGTGDYSLPLADFFPFCIPFDIYKMLSLLSADPVAPSVDYPFPLPGGGTYTIHIDLSQFDSVAQVLRTIEILAFCVGLGFATKKLLFGS